MEQLSVDIEPLAIFAAKVGELESFSVWLTRASFRMSCTALLAATAAQGFRGGGRTHFLAR
jgi:hypothetical protein